MKLITALLCIQMLLCVELRCWDANACISSFDSAMMCTRAMKILSHTNSFTLANRVTLRGGELDDASEYTLDEADVNAHQKYRRNEERVVMAREFPSIEHQDDVLLQRDAEFLFPDRKRERGSESEYSEDTHGQTSSQEPENNNERVYQAEGDSPEQPRPRITRRGSVVRIDGNVIKWQGTGECS